MEELEERMKEFRLPRFQELPKVSLYLDQTMEVVADVLAPLYGEREEKWITSTMIGNYVKKKAVPRPMGKRYGREHIAYLIFIYVAKQVLSLGEIQSLIEVQRRLYTVERAYDYFCEMFEREMREVFGAKNAEGAACESAEAMVVKNLAIAVAHKLYLLEYIERMDR